MKESKSKPFVSFLFCILCPGLGQIYNGQLKKGIIVFLTLNSFVIIIFFSNVVSTFHGMLISMSILILFIIVYCSDAVIVSIKNKNRYLKIYNRWYFYIVLIILNLGYSEYINS